MFDEILFFLDNSFSWIRSSMDITGIIEIIILSVSVYYILLWFQKTQTWTLLKGLLIILGVMLGAYIMQLNVILTLLESAFGVGITAFIVLFQPELRRGLEQLGRRDLRIGRLFDESKNERFSDETKNAIARACFDMGAVKTGALIVIEQMTPLGEHEKTGIPMDSKISSQLLTQIFEKNTPLHDGALIIRRDRIAAATCYLPVSKNMSLSKTLGTRHRAGLGISEVSDCFCIIVSEETGNVSIAQDGELTRSVTYEELQKRLTAIQRLDINVKKFMIWRGKKHEKVIDK